MGRGRVGGLHLVMIILRTAYRDVVAADSLRAMAVRMVVWLIILGLMLIQSWRDKRLPVA